MACIYVTNSNWASHHRAIVPPEWHLISDITMFTSTLLSRPTTHVSTFTHAPEMTPARHFRKRFPPETSYFRYAEHRPNQRSDLSRRLGCRQSLRRYIRSSRRDTRTAVQRRPSLPGEIYWPVGQTYQVGLLRRCSGPPSPIGCPSRSVGRFEMVPAPAPASDFQRLMAAVCSVFQCRSSLNRAGDLSVAARWVASHATNFTNIWRASANCDERR